MDKMEKIQRAMQSLENWISDQVVLSPGRVRAYLIGMNRLAAMQRKLLGY